MNRLRIPLIIAVFGLLTTQGLSADSTPVWTGSSYRGWKSHRLATEFIDLQVVPAIGGRVIQCRFGSRDLFWVNPQLAGHSPTESGLAPDGGWLNYGGEKLWPAPQGWDNDSQWPGPPDAVLDGQPHRAELIENRTALRLTSGDDPISGIRFTRVLRPMPGRSGARFDVTMTNVDRKPHRWGIWSVIQFNAGQSNGRAFNPLLHAYCPINPQSRFAGGFRTIFGTDPSPSFRVDHQHGLVCVDYHYQVGKIAVDSPGGWVATVNGASGQVLVQRFLYEPGREYPDGGSVAFWHNGRGTIHAYNKEIVMPASVTENPFIAESEILSPFAQLQPGESYSWHYDWLAATIGGDFPILACTEAGVTAEPLTASLRNGQLTLRGRFGLFLSGQLQLLCSTDNGQPLKVVSLNQTVSPLKALLLEKQLALPPGTTRVALQIAPVDGSTQPLTLAESALSPEPHP